MVKALNTVTAALMVNPAAVNGGDHTLFVCGNDAHDAPIIRLETVPVAQYCAALEKQADFLTGGENRAQAAFLALLESIRRKPVNVKILNYIQTGCAVALIAFMLYIAFFDVQELSWWKKDKDQPVHFQFPKEQPK